MAESEVVRKAVDRFIIEQIDTVPQLEALLMLWNSRPKQWSVVEAAKALYVPEDVASRTLQELARRGFISPVAGTPDYFCCEPLSAEKDNLLRAVDAIYRKELVRISTMIHAKAPAAIREFARSFRFTKDKDTKDKDKDKDKG